MNKPKLSELKYNTINNSGFITKDLNLFIEDLEEYRKFTEELNFNAGNQEGFDSGYSVGYDEGYEKGLLDGAKNPSNVNF